MPTYDPFDEGDALTAANINSRFSSLQTWVNAIPEESVSRWALRKEHLPSQTFGPSQTVELFPNGFTASCTALGNAGFEYDNSLPYSSGPAHPVNYQAISTTAGTSVAPYGTLTTGGAGDGWRIPSLASKAAPMEVDFGTAISSLGDYGMLGLLVRAQIEIFNAATGTFNLLVNPLDAELSQTFMRRCVLMGIGFEDGLGNRYVIERTVRWNVLKGVTRGTISTSTKITDTDLAVGDGQIAKVFGVIASQDWADTALTNPPSAWDIVVRHYNISVMPLRAGPAV